MGRKKCLERIQFRGYEQAKLSQWRTDITSQPSKTRILAVQHSLVFFRLLPLVSKSKTRASELYLGWCRSLSSAQ
ncbi:hypothetical protein QN277_013764 [Acacia crassicarpa]|uniref:Uncharacterized protein n=1 Tax=Acacia crassicarpa TaxID=499986 RepID=A0AAE1TG09_9FABA|nr:hypothetical protein QN277_013764 [Acacia crassicarpa]